MEGLAPTPEIRTSLRTQFDMGGIIERCYKEAIETGIAEEGKEGVLLILDRSAFALHLQKTLIGELLEFEIIRRLSPIFREIPRLDSDLNLIHRKLEEHNRLISGGRVGPK